MGVGPVGFDVEQQALIWAMWRRGDAIREMERTLGETLPRIRRYLRESGGIPPIPRRRRVGHLSLVEREEISRGIAAGLSGRTIAGRIDRPSSTVSREIARNGGIGGYRALVADAAAFKRARRPKPSKLAANPGLRAVVAAKLDDHLFDRLWPFEELDIAFIGIGFNIATLPVADWRDNEDVLERPVPNKFFHSIRGGRAGEVQ
jgi:Helix-turn-helix domain